MRSSRVMNPWSGIRDAGGAGLSVSSDALVSDWDRLGLDGVWVSVGYCWEFVAICCVGEGWGICGVGEIKVFVLLNGVNVSGVPMQADVRRARIMVMAMDVKLSIDMEPFVSLVCDVYCVGVDVGVWFS